ncbi:unnamed protein product [Arabis nemorensis]|uniref:UBA domain-containing protein n=1 Tax=Arabis nemorensis TaxID=586526 RepID=A0A565B318_9BRAS|nr:unnamed protein product [Arabis nemorensis]
MNTSSQFMDKQIMDLSSSSPPSTDFIDLMNNSSDSQEDDHRKHRIGDNGLESKKEEIVPSYDFQPIRSYTAGGLSHSALDLAGSTTSTSARVWSPSDFKPISTSSNRGFGSFDSSIEPAKLASEKGQNVSSTAIISEIDRTIKKHVDTLLHVMEGVSARVTQLETRSHNLEYLVDDLKASVENSHGSTDGKMRRLENILVEVQSGVQLLKDKQEIIEAQLQLSKLQISKIDHVDPTAQLPAPVPAQQMPQFPHTSFPQPPSSAAAPSQQPSSHQNLQQPSSALLAQLPSQFSPQQEPYSPPPSHSQTPPPYQAPPQTQPSHQPSYQPPPSHSQPPPPNQPPYQAPPQTQPPHQPPYQPPPQQPQYPQQPPLSSGYNPQEQQPYPMQSYSPNPPRQQQLAGSSLSQQFYNAPHPQPSMYDGAGGRSNPIVPPGYSSEPYPYTGSPSSAKQPLMSNSRTGYPQLSTADPLPHALSMASAVSGGSSSPRSESRAPIDDVIDRVTTMGFPRDQVRATVRKLTENGQVVDLNVVLDKLMNDGGAPPGGWLGSR